MGRTGASFVNGNIPPEGAGGLDIVVENFQAADLAALTQTDLDFRGLMSTTARIEGTTRAPRFRAALGIANAMYGGAAVPDVRATANYAAPSLTIHLEAADSGRRVAVADGTIPMNLGSARRRPLFPEAPIAIDARSEGCRSISCRGSPISSTDVRGRAFGVVRVRGTTRHPTTVGALALQNGTVRAGVDRDAPHERAWLHPSRVADTIIIDSIVGRAGGRVLARGGLGIKNAQRAVVRPHARSRKTRACWTTTRARCARTSTCRCRGRSTARWSRGRVGVRNGVIIVPESDNKEVISARDPSVVSGRRHRARSTRRTSG